MTNKQNEIPTKDKPIVKGEEQNLALATNLSSDQGVANEHAIAANTRDDREKLTEQELDDWSSGRYRAGQHDAADSVKGRYEALVRSKHPGQVVDFHRDPETGRLSYQVIGESEKDRLAREEQEREANEKRTSEQKAEAKRQQDEEAKRLEDEEFKRLEAETDPDKGAGGGNKGGKKK